MRSLSQIILLLMITVNIYSQSPHGDDFEMSCTDCHNSKSWKLEAGTYTFDHSTTTYPLTGMHEDVNCKSCHPTLHFDDAETECVSCHTDMHNQTVGMNCADCHTPKSWIVDNITEIHQRSRFPLLGPHTTADCYECHPSASTLEFEPLGIECYDCHRTDYLTTTDPNHSESGFSTDCIECHRIDGTTWTGTNINHAFFPLTEGHAINDCSACHTSNDFNNTPTDCFACHEGDYVATTNPSHPAADLSTNCSECHTTAPGWRPAEFMIHDAQYFPVYSGEHQGEWESCTDCHNTPNNYNLFTCIDCHDHNQPDMNDEHDDVNGYIYESNACFECHPTGDAENVFNHAATEFPLTGAHVNTDCLECHVSGYQGTTMFCFDCHTEAYNQSTNPNHIEAGINNECAECHTTEPGWIPALFPNHDEVYPLTGEHLTTDCLDCHQDNYTNTPNECAGCHLEAFNQSVNPNHLAIGLTNDCALCHTTDPDWQPAAFPVHDEYYVLEGAHVTISADCFECHQGNYTTTPNTCFGCHADEYNQTNDPNHQTAQFPTECEACHTQSAWEPATFNHDGQFFPIYSGEHQGEWDQCSDCHSDPTNYAIFQCLTCHPQGEMDDEHEGIPGYAYNSINCLECHPDGSSASGFDHSITNFPLTGAHTTIDCSDCHEGGYTNTPDECVGCHLENFNQTTDPNHIESGFPQECEICHTTNPGWTPASYSGHDEIYPLTGAHTTISCFDCHEGNYTNTPNECAGCHQENFNQTNNPSHNDLGLTNECALCHTTNPDWQPAAFPVHDEYYVLQGAHVSIANDCFECHEDNYNTTPNTCYGCHLDDYNATNDPPHQSAQFPTDCETCHTQNAWEPSTFNHDGQYFPIYSGEHEGEWDQCSDCHNDPSNYAIFQCLSCHPQGEMDDEHDDVPGYVYNSIACFNCHPNGGSEQIRKTKLR
ncbi:MAG: hypothetical protein KQI35_01355 [Bacteroidetes bacterium]|nr:hypothetical protein [Bacteroidota bacterium]